MTTDVLLIHNPIKISADKNRPVFQESIAGLKEQIDAVAAALKSLGVSYQAKSVESLQQLPSILVANNQPVIFNLVEEFPSNITDACFVPSVCKAFGRAFTGCDTPTMLLAQNKWQSKAVLKACDIPVPDGTIVAVGSPLNPEKLSTGKYLIKPAFSDASEGIDVDCIVDIPGRAAQKVINRIHEQFKQPAIVEQFIPSRELNVSLLCQQSTVNTMPIAEIDFSAFDKNKPRIVDYAAKWLTDSFEYNNTPRVIPAPLSKKTAEQVRNYSIAAWHAINCRDYVRVDFRLDNNDNPFVLEVNPNPDISPDAGFAAAISAGGISYEKFVQTLLNNASIQRQNYGK